MSFHRQIITTGLILFMLIGVGFTELNQDQDSKLVDRINGIKVIARANQWSLILPDNHPVLKEVIKLKKAARDQLVNEGDAQQRGIGLFIADQQGDIAALLAWEELLDDKELTVSYALPLAQPEEYAAGEQTVSEYLNSIYHDWIGVDVDGSRKRFAKLIGEIDKPELLIHPWIVKLKRARGDAKVTKSLKNEIEKLPEEVRWAVITIGWCDSLYIKDEAQKLLAGTSPVLRKQIQSDDSGIMNLSEEPMFRASSAYYSAVINKCRLLLD